MDFDQGFSAQVRQQGNSRQEVLAHTLKTLREKMSQKYNCSQAYSELEVINRIVEPDLDEENANKKPLLDRILLNDLKFMEPEEYLEQTYQHGLTDQLTDLFEYYKYYLQDPAIYFREHYDVMHRYYERRKGHVYNQLKKILTLSEVEDGKQDGNNQQSFLFQSGLDNSAKGKKKKQRELDPGLANILAEITLNRSSHKGSQVDESLHFDELKAKLVKFYGPPSAKSMQIIDSIYNFNKVGQDHLPFKNQHKFYHAQTGSRKDLGEVATNNFKKKHNLFNTNTSTRFMESTNMSNSQRCPHTSINQQQATSAIRNKEQGASRRGARRKSGRRYKSTGNSQDASDLKIHVSQQNLPKFPKNATAKKSKLRRKSSDLLYNYAENCKIKQVFTQQPSDSKNEEQQLSKTTITKKGKHTGRVKSTEFNLDYLNPCMVSVGMETYLQGTIAKFKKKIQDQKQEIIHQKKAHTLVPQKSSGTLKTGTNYREIHNNFTQHSQIKKKPGTKSRVKPEATIGALQRNY